MSRESNLAISVWEAVHDYLPVGKRLDAAEGILRALEEYGMEKVDLEHIVDEDPWLAKAFREVFSDEDEEEEEDE